MNSTPLHSKPKNSNVISNPNINLISKRAAVGLALEPVFDVLVNRAGEAVVQVMGVSKPFDIHVPAQTLVDGAPFGKPSRSSIMATAQVLAEHECRQRGFI